MRIKQAGIYQITNLVNGDFYIGSSIDIASRWSSHRYFLTRPKSPYRSYLHNAVQWYGIENFSFDVVETCKPMKRILLEREQYYIDTLLPIYNLLPTAGSRLGSRNSPETIARQRGRKIHSNEHKQYLSEYFRAYMNDPANKERYRALRLGKSWDELFGEERSAEIRAKMSASRKLSPTVCAGWNKGLAMPDEQKAKLFAGRDAWLEAGNRNGFQFKPGHVPYNVGVPMTDEHRIAFFAGLRGYLDKHGVWNRGRAMTSEEKQKLSEARTGKGLGLTPWNAGLETGPRSEETKKKISESHKVSEARQVVYEARKGYVWTDEQRQQISDANKHSERALAYHQGRIGKSRGNNPSGHYGVIWDKNRNKWQVRVQGKLYGRFDKLEDAIARVDLLLA